MGKLTSCIMAIAGVITAIGLWSRECTGENFHNGGQGACQGCHTEPPALLGTDPGSTCLRCHQAPAGVTQPKDHYVSTDPHTVMTCAQLPPGGDFCWLKKNYRWSISWQEENSRGERHGHNIVALDYGYEADTTLVTAPGGSYPSSALSCISCHDPHGNYRRNADGSISTTGLSIIASGSYSTSPDPSAAGSVGTYRLLAGKGYQPKSLAGGLPLSFDPPVAVAPPSYNRPETSAETRVAYGSGMSEWCQNCHVGFRSAAGNHQHPSGNSDRLPMDLINNYNFYIASGNLNGNPNAAYTSLIPFEMGTRDYELLKRVANSTNADRSGPQSGATVMCLTCHRAHASGWDSNTRWNTRSEFIIYNNLYPGIDNSVPPQYAQGRQAVETQKAYYDRPVNVYAPFQRSLCNKCHAKD